MPNRAKTVPVSRRLWWALLVTFFPVGILFPLDYPIREIITLLAWIWAVPSITAIAGAMLLPLLGNEAIGYWAFNIFCVLGTVGTGFELTRLTDEEAWPWDKVYKIARGCMIVTLILAILQGIDGDIWLQTFPAMFALGDGRGSGFRTEPSLVAPCVALYLGLALIVFERRRTERKPTRGLIREIIVITLLSIVLTQSFSVVLVAIAFLPSFGLNLRRLAAYVFGGLLVLIPLLWARAEQAISSGGDWTYMITTGVGSWRNIPDLLILFNAKKFLLPPAPGEVRSSINLLATLWDPDLAWLENTYSTFSAVAMTLGLAAAAGLFCAGLVFAARRIELKSGKGLAWILIYLINWVFLPKYEASGWVALAILTIAVQANQTVKSNVPNRVKPIPIPPQFPA